MAGCTDEEILIKFLILKLSESNSSCLWLLSDVLSVLDMCICIKNIYAEVCNIYAMCILYIICTYVIYYTNT